ncbi:hypothetical protein HOY82DRAFT_541142 [Tuber indicum]|nr:hypothetical protein HOY82DRAFT_541142 [Tuber indicum]
MAKDVLAVQGGSVGVERAAWLEEKATIEDYRCWADQQEKSTGEDYGCISDDDESQKEDTVWSFVDQDGSRAFAKEPKPLLPGPGTVESQYARPARSQIQADQDQLKAVEESDADYGIWESAVNMYVASNSEDGEDSWEDHSTRSLSEPEDSNDAERTSSTNIVESGGRQEEVRLGEEARSGTARSVPLILRVTRSRVQEDSSSIGTTTRKRAGTGGKPKKRSRVN